MIYYSTLLPKLEAGQSAIETIKGFMIQSTAARSDVISSLYDDIDDHPEKRYANYAIFNDAVAKFAHSTTSVLISGEVFTERAKTLLSDVTNPDDSPSLHLGVIEVMTPSPYADTEKSLIKFLGRLLKDHGLTTDNLFRRDDLIVEAGYINTLQYAALENWKKLLSAVSLYIEELTKETPDENNVTITGIVVPSTAVFEPDDRDIKSLTSVAAIDFLEEDYEVSESGDVTTRKDRFTNELSTNGSQNGELFEPIYPDFTVPPVNYTGLYNKQVHDIRQEQEKTKPVLGKIVNNQDPYPVDDKIVELEEHYPIIQMDDEALNQMSSSLPQTAAYMLSMSQRTERRVVQLENTLSTLMRYFHRMSSRVHINCVYYGGQSQFGKYDCIRCLADDMVNDGQVVTMDQCLNCSRYEPILGQVYEILNEDMEADLAAVLDDNQMARMTMDERIKLSRLEKMVDDPTDATATQEDLEKKDPDDKDFDETLQDEETQMMIWAETDLSAQRPDVNEYDYDPAEKMKNKDSLLDPKNAHKDYYSEVEKREIVSRPNEYSVTAASVSSGGGYVGMDSYDFTGSEKRVDIIATARELIALGKQEKCQYVLGGRIYDKYFSKTPQEIYDMLQAGEKVNYTSQNALKPGVLSLDCSAFVRYCFMHNGISIPDITGPQRKFCTVVGKAGDFKASVAAASPGDLVFYTGHVAIYAGNGKILHAANSSRAANDQVREGDIYSSGFISIGRHPALTEAKIKSSRSLNIPYTLQEAAKKQLSASTGPNGRDHEPTNIDEIISYMNPANHMTGNERYQFMDLSVSSGLTVTELQAFLRSVGAAQSLIDNAQAYIDGGAKYGVNEAYLAAHSCLETGNGKKGLALGRPSSSGRTVYNMYGIAAYNSDPSRKAAIKIAEENGWFSVREALIGGAKFVAEKYIAVGQNTIYSMRWNPNKPGTHQYATDVAWAIKQTPGIADMMSKLPKSAQEKLVFQIPVYKA